MPIHYKTELSLDEAAVTAEAVQAAKREVTTVTRRILNRATVLTPVDTGNLRAHNRMRVKTVGPVVTGEVFNFVDYAPHVHDGTQAHTVRPKPRTITIRPRNAKVLRFVVNGEVVFARSVRTQAPLRFKIGGRTIFARSVNIPAKKGRPFILRAVKEVAVQRGYRFVAT